LDKYWAQRFSLFSRFNDGIQLDDESWWSVTPEKIAHHIAARFHKSLGGGHLTIVDGFCGVGGNLIQFALYSPHIRVIGCDINLERLMMAKHNAKIYGVEHQCEFILGDFMSIIQSLQCQAIDAIFLSPPWGGVDYGIVEKYSLNQMTPDGYEIVKLCRKYITNDIAFLMPRNTDIDEVRRVLLTKQYPELECEHNMVGTKVKTITMYFGRLINPDSELAESSSQLLNVTNVPDVVTIDDDIEEKDETETSLQVEVIDSEDSW